MVAVFCFVLVTAGRSNTVSNHERNSPPPPSPPPPPPISSSERKVDMDLGRELQVAWPGARRWGLPAEAGLLPWW